MFAYELSDCGFQSRCSHLKFRYCACVEQGVLEIQATIECENTLKRVHDMIGTYRQNHMLLTHSCNTCYLLRNLCFFFFWDIMQQYHKKIVYILVALLVVVNFFQFYLTIGLSF